MTWQPELDDLALRRQMAARLGGEERVTRHRALGKLTCRERIASLLDAGSFRELGSATGKATYDSKGALVDLAPANFVSGRGTIEGRPVMVGADDFTVRGGHADGAIWRKQVYGEQLARHLRIPMVRLIDGSSGGGSVATYEETGRTYVPPCPASPTK